MWYPWTLSVSAALTRHFAARTTLALVALPVRDWRSNDVLAAVPAPPSSSVTESNRDFDTLIVPNHPNHNPNPISILGQE